MAATEQAGSPGRPSGKRKQLVVARGCDGSQKSGAAGGKFAVQRQAGYMRADNGEFRIADVSYEEIIAAITGATDNVVTRREAATRAHNEEKNK